MILLGPTEENIECPEGLDSIGLLLEVSWADAAAVASDGPCSGAVAAASFDSTWD